MKTIFETITWPQVATVALLLAFAFVAYRYLGTEAGAAIHCVATIVAFLAGRSSSGA